VASNVVVGADVGGTSVKYVIAASDGRRLWQGKVPTDPTDPAATLARLAAAVGEQLAAADRAARVAAVGLACAGIVSPESGRLGRSPNLPGWQDSDLVGSLQAAFGSVATAVANDVNAALYGEYLHGAGRGCRQLVMIALGTGVGGAVLIAGELLSGLANGAGEIGHMTLDLDGPPCRCGNRGCLEAYCGSTGLLAQARRLATAAEATTAWRDLVATRGESLTTRDCHALAMAGDPTARGFFAEAGRRLGQASASLVNVLAPERVIIGGGVAQAGDLILVPCREMVAQHVMSDAGRATPVVPAALGAHAAAIGAAALAGEAGAIP
jgi:glucokinase